MTNHKLDQTGSGALPTPLKAPEVIARFPRELQPPLVRAIAAFIAIAMAIYFWRTEGGPNDVFFVSAVTLTIAALILLISRRILLAAVLVTAIVAVLSVVAFFKQQITDVVLHAYDVVSFLTSWSAVTLLWQDHRQLAVGVMAAVMAGGTLGWIVYRLDSTRIRRFHALAAAAIFASLAWFGADAKDARRHMGFYYEYRYLWFFFSSWAETAEALWRGHLIEAATEAPGPVLKLPASCNLASKPPHIILIHEESVVPPSYFPSLNYDRSIDQFFRSFDGKLHKLRVETYGGASWLTEFSVLTGLSAFSLGNLRQFVQPIMAGKVRDTLPQALARCGYRNIAFHPMLRIYLSIGKFFEAVGLHQMFDAKDQGVKSATERDRIYYLNALAEMERHFKVSNQPLFTFIETMATHGPYSYTSMPEVDVPGGGPGTDPDMHEYLRRLSMAGMDYAFLRSELARRFPDQSFLIIHYGDHHPTVTRTLLGYGKEVDIEQVLRSGNPAALITYYVVDAVHYQALPLPDLEILGVPYLGTIMLEAARLPLSDTYRERKRLMMLCNGQYHGCSETLHFHRRLIDSGIVDAL
jgi:hypothetical protein